MNSKQPSPEPITAKKTGMILYYPRLENAERTSTKPHQHVPRAQPTGDPDDTTLREQQSPDLSKNRLRELIQAFNKGFLSVKLATKVHQHCHFTGSIQGGSRGLPEKNQTPLPYLATPL